VKLAKSPVYGRIIRQGSASDLARPTWELVDEAIEEGKLTSAVELIEYGCYESRSMHDSLVSMFNDALTYIAQSGEEELNKFIRAMYEGPVRKMLRRIPGTEEFLQLFLELQRSHFSRIGIREEPDRVVATFDPCGSGGKLLRTKHVSKTKSAYPFSWNETGVPYYCLHCCIAWEIIPTEIQGHPIRVHLFPHNPEDSCVHYYYRKPHLIPEEFFRRIGFPKPSGAGA